MNPHSLASTFIIASVLGIFLIILADRLRISAIVLLLLGGIMAGPEFLGWVNPKDLGNGLSAIISIAVGLILFEGGLTLDIQGYRQVSKEIQGVLTWGVLVTWVLTSLFVWFIFDFGVVFSVLTGSLIIVTGPTVISPLLQRVRVKRNLHQILYWEGVLIDPIGVFIALLCYEWILTAGAQDAYFNFLNRILVGFVVGLGAGWLIHQILKREWIKDERLNIFMLTMAMLILAVSNGIVEESGLLSVTLAGLYLGYKKPPHLASVIAYKVELKDLLIGLLFVLLAANLEVSRFLDYGVKLLWILALVMLVVRPINIFLSTLGSKLTLKEKLFLCWVAPRGIVAASMASFFALNLAGKLPESNFLETFTYTVIAGTVLFQGFSAKFVAQWLGVYKPHPTGWLIVGAHKLGRATARYLMSQGKTVILMDSNLMEVKQALREGLLAIPENALQVMPDQYPEFAEVGNVLAITVNSELNRLLCHRWSGLIKQAELYYWSEKERSSEGQELTKGKPIWTNLNVKSVLARNIDVGELITSVNEINLPYQITQVPGLMYLYDGKLTPLPPDEKKGTAQMLVLRPLAKDSLGMKHHHLVHFSKQTDLRSLYTEMLGLLHRDFTPIEIQTLVNHLISREEEFSSLLSNSIALPHCYDPNILETITIVARLENPIPVPAKNSGILIVFMVLSPEGQPEKHLQQISKIAKFIISEENRQAMLLARTAKELYDILETSDIGNL